MAKDKKYVINGNFIRKCNELNLNITEFLILLYYDNIDSTIFDLKGLKEKLNISESDILSTINTLMQKKLIVFQTEKNEFNKLIEVINIDKFYELIEDDKSKEKSKDLKKDIYTIFQENMGKPISSMEYELINNWLEKKYSEELIILALKEAIYNGVNSFRYIDKILYEWNKKGLKNSSDVDKYLKNYKESKENKEQKSELFDYDWLSES